MMIDLDMLIDAINRNAPLANALAAGSNKTREAAVRSAAGNVFDNHPNAEVLPLGYAMSRVVAAAANQIQPAKRLTHAA